MAANLDKKSWVWLCKSSNIKPIFLEKAKSDSRMSCYSFQHPQSIISNPTVTIPKCNMAICNTLPPNTVSGNLKISSVWGYCLQIVWLLCFASSLLAFANPFLSENPLLFQRLLLTVVSGWVKRFELRKIRRCGQDFCFFSVGNPLTAKVQKQSFN